MGLDDALIFTRVVEYHGFTQAAQSLGMQKFTVSRRIALLEERLGVRLLNRTTRKLRLTEVGQAYYDAAGRSCTMISPRPSRRSCSCSRRRRDCCGSPRR